MSENTRAWLMVSKDSAKAAPIAAMITGWLARARRSAHQPPRTAASGTARPAGVRANSIRLAMPSATSTPIEIQAPTCSSQRGACQSAAASATATPTSVTTTPWPSEKNSPDQRARRGRRRTLERTRPSIATRWSGSKP